MRRFNHLWRALCAAAVIGAVWPAGCAKKSEREAAPIIPVALSVASDTLSKTFGTLSAASGVLFEKSVPPLAASGALVDSRDGRRYRKVKLGHKVWMAENLNYRPSKGNSRCYGGDTSYCGKYGRLYDWETAVSVCPAGWHLPSREEWGDLAIFAGGNAGSYGEGGERARN